MDHEAFLRAIAGDPHDITPRLIYADWLEEQGDPRAEFIRLQCILADEAEATMDAASLDEDRHDPLMSHDLLLRSEDLLRQYEADWVGEIKQFARRWVFRRGFIEYVELSMASFVKNAARLVQLAPITAAAFTVTGRESIGKLAATPQLAQFVGLSFDRCQLKSNHVQELCHSTHLTGLKRLSLSTNWFASGAAEALAQCAGFQSLELLDLSHNRIRNQGAEALAKSQHLGKLNTLLLADNEIRVTGARAIAASETITALVHLDFSSNPIEARGVEALRGRFGREVCRV